MPFPLRICELIDLSARSFKFNLKQWDFRVDVHLGPRAMLEQPCYVYVARTWLPIVSYYAPIVRFPDMDL